MRALFFVYVLIQLSLPVVVVWIWGNEIGDLIALWLVERHHDPHGFVKEILESSQGILLRQREILFRATMVAAVAGTTAISKRRWYGYLGVVLFTGVVLDWRTNTAALLAGCLLCCQMMKTLRWTWIHWLPYLGFSFAASMVSSARMMVRGALVTVAAFVGLFGCIWVDCLLAYDDIRSGMEAWPEELLDERIQIRAQEPGVRADWHDVDIQDEVAFVVAEETMRLMAFPMQGGEPIVHKLGERWGTARAAPLDLEYDKKSGLFWVVTDERTFTGFSFDVKEGWKEDRRYELPEAIQYAYLRAREGSLVIAPLRVKEPLIEGCHLIFGTVNNGNQLRKVSNDPRSVIIPFPREIEWIGSLDKLAVSPDFGKEIFLFDLYSGWTERLIQVPTLDGKMRWSSKLDRLFIAIPNRFEIWVVDPHKRTLDWVIPTQPGVRSLAIDEQRGVIVSASVLTGQVLVQDIRTGKILDRFGTVMPMVRDLALDVESGQAVLTTWAAVYQFPYAEEL